jgi:hypothetical protein
MNAPTSEDLAISLRSLNGPGWRWKFALEAAAGAPAVVSDPWIAEAVKFIRLLENEQTELARQRHPSLAAAHALWDQLESRKALTILALGDCAVEDIARRLGTSEEVIRCVESLYCDLRECRQATDWMQLQVIAPALKAGDTAAAVRYRAALYGGPLVAQAVLDADQRVPLDEVQRLADQELKLHLKAQEALELVMTDAATATKYIALYLMHQRQCEALQLRKEQFRHRVHQDLLRSHRAQPGSAASSETACTPEHVARSPLAALRWFRQSSNTMETKLPTTATEADGSELDGAELTALPVSLPVDAPLTSADQPDQPAQAA